ncbi:Gfo/Idh/MocA family protein [Chitiniphilus eburneus]|uniref:Gfo/Idh/MocA family oxidoreductase n=1 Tax=Chitiniphilus eburneus TaxID=2571148 RepID=A0A4U0PHL8_9NEIS|nr:Gfo/Idh/MocA family oxidoreductase [Chitiniphilus eburneus]TJZ67453.1 Gfo/Idh/MocA family oxidoreductase [Chitiniphilus eburneus]
MNPLRFGLIGCGQFGAFLARAAVATGRLQLVAATDSDAARADTLAAEHQAAACADAAALLAHPAVDVVLIATPPALHMQHAIAAARAGKPVFLEKPMAIGEHACEAINAAVREAGVNLMVGHVLRYFEPYRAIAAAYRAGKLGRALHLSIWRLEHDFLNISPWKGQRAVSGGYLYEVAAHELDWLRAMLGEPTAIQAQITRQPSSAHQLEDTVALQLMFPGGAGVHYLGGAGFPRNEHGFHLRFEHATLNSDQAFDPARVQVASSTGLTAADLGFGDADPYSIELNAWLDSLATGSPPPITGEDAAQTVALIEAAYRAAGW